MANRRAVICGAVAFLSAMLATGQHDYTVLGQARACQRLGADFDFVGAREAVARIEVLLGGGGSR